MQTHRSALSVPDGYSGQLPKPIQFPGPAYRTLPASPLALYQLHVQTKSGVVEGPDKPPTLCAEAWAGGAGISQQLARVGFTVRAYESSPDGLGSHVPEGDVSRPENQQELAAAIK